VVGSESAITIIRRGGRGGEGEAAAAEMSRGRSPPKLMLPRKENAVERH
jgi:hypothetical protein